MDYINYIDFISVDSSILTNKAYHNYRVMYRLFRLIGRYLNASITQYNRIEEWVIIQRGRGSRTISGNDIPEVEQIFSDLHFLIISMDKCYKYIHSLYIHLGDNNTLKKIEESNQACDIRIMRNTLEHSEEKISDDNKNEKYNLPEEYKTTGWSWLEYQLLSLRNGKFFLKDKVLEFNPLMFNEIISHMNNIAKQLQLIFDNL